MLKKKGILILATLFTCTNITSQEIADFKKIQTHPTKLGILLRRQVSISNRFRIWNYYFLSKAFGQYKTYSGFRPTKDWKLTFYDHFDSFDKNKWRKGQPWGAFHPGFPHQYYLDSSVYTKNGNLYLDGAFKPKKFDVFGKDSMIPYGVGLVITDNSFRQKFGYFEIRSKNPSGPATWPAFWLTGTYSWPPEIDIFEMYGKRKGHRIHFRQTNIHWGEDGKKSKGELINGMKLSPDTDSMFHIYGCNWTSKSISFYTDGILTRKIKLNKKMQHWFNQPMVVIINNSIDHRYLKYIDNKKLPTHFVIDYVKVYQNINLK